MACTATSVLPPRHFRDRFVIDGPERPSRSQNFQRATSYILYLIREKSKELKVRAREKAAKHDLGHCGVVRVQPTEAVADYTEPVYRAMKQYLIEMKYNGSETTFDNTRIGPNCLWEDLAGAASHWATMDEKGEMSCMPTATRCGYLEDPEYNLDLAPDETVEEAIQIARRHTEPATASAEAREAQAADKKRRGNSIAEIIVGFIKKRFSHSHHH